MPTAEEIRDAQRATWAALSPGWDTWDAVIAAQLRPVGDAMISALDITGDAPHLDVASGTGEPGLTVARHSPGARVVLTDLSPEMLAVAVRRADHEGLTNVEARVCSADALPFDDDAFATASARFGFMFFPDPAAAAGEIARVLRPGGRVCASVWVRPDDNPWTSVLAEAIATEVVTPPVAPGAPHMFRFAEPGAVSALLEWAGFEDAREWDVPVVLTVESSAQYWQVMAEHVSMAVVALRDVDDATRSRIRDRTLEAVEAFVENGAVRVPGVARCIVGTRA